MRLVYRPEIDGLRAVSVFAVIIYHANFVLFGHTLFQGGFIGVDIFFVISGYLITNLILKEILQTNQFSFKYFYERRIRRIIPVLVIVLIVTSVISYFVLLPPSLIDYGKSVFSIIFFISNYYFYLNGDGYEQLNSQLKPLLHTWSLSVEEQFYILFPIFLFTSIIFFRKYFTIVLFLIFFISLFSTIYISKIDPSNNFYMLRTRVFELIIGSLLSYFKLNIKTKKDSSINYVFKNVYPSLGIMLIFFSFLLFNFKKISNPSVITLIPIIGVSLIIWFSKRGQLITKILSSKIFVFFGLCSYSLYLWHYPIFAFLKYVEIFNDSIQIKLLAIILTIILSILSYYFIERPFRNKDIIPVKALCIYITISVIILLSYSFYVLKTEGIKKRFPEILVKPLFDISSNYKIISNIADRDGLNILLIGDSTAGVLKYNLEQELIKSYNFFAFKNCCGYLYLQNYNRFFPDTNQVDKDYLKNINSINSILKEKKDLVVIMSHYWWNYLHYAKDYKTINNLSLLELKNNNLFDDLILAINDIIKNQNSIILIYPTVNMNVDVQRYVLKKYLTTFDKLKSKNKNIDLEILTIDYDDHKKKQEFIFKTLDGIQGSNVYRVYPDKSFCNTIIINKCVGNDKENLFYYDEYHLSLEGSKYVVRDIMKVIQEIVIKKKLNL